MLYKKFKSSMNQDLVQEREGGGGAKDTLSSFVLLNPEYAPESKGLIPYIRYIGMGREG